MSKDYVIRDVREADLDYVLALNEKDVVVLSPMDRAKADYFRQTAELFKVVEVDGQPVREGRPGFIRRRHRRLHPARAVCARGPSASPGRS